MKRDVHHICDKCLVCKSTKAKVKPHGSYTPLPIPTMPWVTLSMDFVLSLPRSKNGKYYIFMVVDRFSKMTHFIPYHKVDDACIVANLFFKEVVRLHGLPKTIVLDRDSNKLDTKLLFSTVCHLQIDRQTKVTNKTLSQLLKIVNTTTSHSPFELVYDFNSLTPLDLLPIFQSLIVKDLHAKTHSHIKKKVKQYASRANKGKTQKKERFPNLRKSKLLLRGDGLFNVIKKINDNDYILDMPQSYEGNHTFHEKDNQELRGSIRRGILKRLQENVLQKIGMLRSLEASSLSPSPSLALYFI
ncbi:hypothetical protein CR513_31579, partial [Mucuna pruriens]